MAQTSGSGGIGSLTLGGIAAVAVIVGGVVVMLWLDGDQTDPSSDRALREGANSDVTISPSTGNPVVVPSTQAGQEEDPAPAADSDAQAVSQPAESSTAVAPQDVVREPVPEPSESPVVETAVEPVDEGQTAAPDTPQGPVENAQAVDLPDGDEVQAQPQTSTAPERAPVQEDTAAVAVPAAGETGAREAETTPKQPQPEGEAVSLTAPLLDLVRVDPEGALVIAGRAQAGARVQVLIDGAVLEETEVQGGGEFAVFSSITPSDRPRVISLLARAGGQEAASLDQFIIAPAAPVPAPQVADAGVPQPTTPGTEALAATTLEETPQVLSTEPEGSSEPTLPEADAPEADAGTAEAQTPAPPVTAQVGAPAQPDDGATEEVSVQTAEVDTVQAAPQETAAPQSQPAARETPASAETEPAPRPEATAVAVLRAGADGVELVQPAAPVLNGKVALDTISYSDSGAVLLAGRGRPDALVRAYVNNQIKAELPVAEDGRWGGALGEVEPGIYTLRLDEVDVASGSVLSRLETPFKREAPEVLQPPAQEPGAAPDQPVPLVRAVTVQKGDTLWAISQQRYGSGFLYVRVFEANQDAIRDPDLIYPGQVFNLPE